MKQNQKKLAQHQGEALSTRARNVITNICNDKRIEDPTPTDVASISDLELLNWRGCGRKTMIEINNWLAGYKLRTRINRPGIAALKKKIARKEKLLRTLRLELRRATGERA